MNAFGAFEGFATPAPVMVDVYTSAYRISGTVHTPFKRVAEILNQLPGGHLTVERATISEHGADGATIASPSALVATDEILAMLATDLPVESRGEMRIQKRPVRAQLAIPPLRLTGTIHVPMGSRPVDGLLNVPDRFMPMTDVAITCAAFPHLERSAAIIALRRDRAHVLLVADDERPDELLADVLDERAAESWLRPGEERG